MVQDRHQVRLAEPSIADHDNWAALARTNCLNALQEIESGVRDL
jgi:hypothetical protein